MNQLDEEYINSKTNLERLYAAQYDGFAEIKLEHKNVIDATKIGALHSILSHEMNDLVKILVDYQQRGDENKGLTEFKDAPGMQTIRYGLLAKWFTKYKVLENFSLVFCMSCNFIIVYIVYFIIGKRYLNFRNKLHKKLGITHDYDYVKKRDEKKRKKKEEEEKKNPNKPKIKKKRRKKKGTEEMEKIYGKKKWKSIYESYRKKVKRKREEMENNDDEDTLLLELGPPIKKRRLTINKKAKSLKILKTKSKSSNNKKLKPLKTLNDNKKLKPLRGILKTSKNYKLKSLKTLNDIDMRNNRFNNDDDNDLGDDPFASPPKRKKRNDNDNNDNDNNDIISMFLVCFKIPLEFHFLYVFK